MFEFIGSLGFVALGILILADSPPTLQLNLWLANPLSDSLKNQLNDFLRAGNNSSINSITQNLLKDALNYLKYNESILF